jgi:hypothetical protein
MAQSGAIRGGDSRPSDVRLAVVVHDNLLVVLQARLEHDLRSEDERSANHQDAIRTQLGDKQDAIRTQLGHT